MTSGTMFQCKILQLCMNVCSVLTASSNSNIILRPKSNEVALIHPDNAALSEGKFSPVTTRKENILHMTRV
jgi:hypothetical protein